MAPEMANGEAVDRRADLYALGCVAYWLLTGHLVFEAESALRMLIQHIQAQPVPPSQRSDQVVPPTLERLIMRCLEKDPARRPSSADEIVAELDGAEVESAWDQQRAREWWERHVAAPAALPTITERPLLAVRS
jgi:serine/threonine protein kinase